MPTSIYHARLSAAPSDIRLGGAYRRTGLISDNSLCSFVHLTEDFAWPAGMDADRHECDQLMYIIDGKLEMVLNGSDSYRLERDDALYIPSNVSHVANLIDGSPCYLLEIFAPIRTDYLHIAEHQIDHRVPPRDERGFRVDDRPHEQHFQAYDVG